MNNIRIAKELVKIAKMLVAAGAYGEVYYRLVSSNPSTIAITFAQTSKDFNKTMGWFDALLSESDAIKKIAPTFGYKQDEKSVADPKSTAAINNGMTLSLFFEGEDNCDQKGFIDHILNKYHAREIK